MDENLYGRGDLRLDAKGRFALPAKYCPPFAAGERAVLARNPLGWPCLAIYTPKAFERLEAKMQVLQDSEDEAEQWAARIWAADTERVQIDAQRRISIPGHLREFAHLRVDTPALMVGQMTYAEIWDIETFRTESAARSNSRGRGGAAGSSAGSSAAGSSSAGSSSAGSSAGSSAESSAAASSAPPPVP